MKIFIKNHLLIIILIFFVGISGLSAWAGCKTSTAYYEERSSVMALSWSLKPTKSYSDLYFGTAAGSFLTSKGDDLLLIDAAGKPIKRIKNAEYSLGDGLYEYTENDQYGIKDEDGNIVVKAIYNNVEPFLSGYTIATDSTGSPRLLDKKGHTVFYDKSANEIIHVDGTTYLIKTNGTSTDMYLFDAVTGEKKKVPSTISDLESDDNGGYIAYLYEGGHCFLKDDFTLAEDTKLYKTVGELSEGLRYAEIFEGQNADKISKDFDENTTKTTCGYIDEKGKLIIKLPYYTTDRANPFSEGKSLVYANSEIRCIDKTGNILFNLKTHYKNDDWFLYETVFAGGLAPVTLDGVHYGFINERGKFVIAPYFTDATEIEDGRSIVKYRDAYGILNLKEAM